MPPKEQRTNLGAHGGYDQSLIAQAPEITKADRQEGYDINLVTHPPPSRPQTVPPTSYEKAAPINGYSTEFSEARRTPWYRTTKGLAIIIVVAVLFVGVVVGVPVGVTQSRKNGPSSFPLLNETTSADLNLSTGVVGSVAPTSVIPIPATGIRGTQASGSSGTTTTPTTTPANGQPPVGGIPATR